MGTSDDFSEITTFCCINPGTPDIPDEIKVANFDWKFFRHQRINQTSLYTKF